MVRAMKVRGIAAGLGAALLSGCFGLSTLKTARPLTPGTWEIAVAGGAAEIQTNTQDDSRSGLSPMAQVSGRYGVTSSFDLGLAYWVSGGEITSTIGVLRSPTLDIALAPSLGLVSWGYGEFHCPANGCPVGISNTLDLYLKIPVLFGVHFVPDGDTQLIFGPEIVPLTVLSPLDPVLVSDFGKTGALMGGLVGVSFPIRSNMRLMPEVTVLAPIAPIYSPGEDGTPGFAGRGALVVEAALGCAWAL